MPRQYTRKTDQGLVGHDAMLAAVKMVKTGQGSIRQVARDKGISKSVLARYVTKYENDQTVLLSPNYLHSQVFTTAQENELAEYLLTCSKMFHALTPQKVRQLAYQTAVKNNIKMHKSWTEQEMAGADWLTGFMKRHGRLSIRSPEATSIARATAFNKHTVGVFFDLLEKVISNTRVTGRRIFNLDETGFTTVQKVPKVIAEKGTKQVGQVVSRERGELVTVVETVLAVGNSLPPVFIFPRKNYRDIMLQGAPEGSLGLAYETGWMTIANFLKVMQHIVLNTEASLENPIVLVMDNHESHISLDALTYAKEHGVHIITLPPHTSQKTQPLDRSVFGPMKNFYNAAANSWMLKNPAQAITIYQVAELVGIAWIKASTPSNITAGFKAAGIWPLGRHIFKDESYLPSSVTDRPSTAGIAHIPELHIPGTVPPPSTTDHPSTAGIAHIPELHIPGTVPHEVAICESNPSPTTADGTEAAATKQGNTCKPSTSAFIVSPELFRGYPKAPARKETTRGRKRGKAMIATSTPEMKRIEEEKDARAAKRAKKNTSSVRKVTKDLFSKKQSSSDDDEAEDNDIVQLCDDDDDDNEYYDRDESESEVVLGDVEEVVAVGSFVLVEYIQKGKKFFYVGQVISPLDENEYEIDFYRKSTKARNQFVKPQVQDIAIVEKSQIKAVLSSKENNTTGTTSRTKGSKAFGISFDGLDVR